MEFQIRGLPDELIEYCTTKLPTQQQKGIKKKGKKGVSKEEILENTKQYEQFSQVYHENIGLYGKGFVLLRPNNSVRALWTGTELVNPEHYQKLTDTGPQLPKNLPLDGFWVNESNKFYAFDQRTTLSTPYEQRYLTLLQTTKRFELELCEITPLPCMFRSFPEVISKLNEIQNNNNHYKDGIYIIDALKSDGYELRRMHTREALIIGLVEGCFALTGKLSKFKCRDPGTHRSFYCSKNIPNDLRNAYEFERTKLIRIHSPEKVPVVGDTLVYACVDFLRTELPRDPYYKSFVKQQTQ